MKDGNKLIMHWRSPNYTGQTFGVLKALHPGHSDGRKRYWVYQCECGTIVEKVGSEVTKEIKRGGTPNCGCLTGSLISKGNRKHGMSKHPAFAVWRSMLDRCRLPTHQSWHNYGKRGIRVCERWVSSFENFWEDMGPTYQSGLTLDRTDNDGPYSPENCRWVSRETQSNNTRRSVLINTPKGRMSPAQAAKIFGIGKTTLYYRIKNGWPEDKLFIIPDVTNRVSMI